MWIIVVDDGYVIVISFVFICNVLCVDNLMVFVLSVFLFMVSVCFLLYLCCVGCVEGRLLS